ncbi:metallophosphoesterase [Candidatus Epulonipiscium fishelsonii]|uniref:Metallophosphoesterase n=1 Tax=Candidatus Epulonipiscium fishelsonii TaxID=77094 RepID=A0ACC8XH80_9FIRM|nr:metallophosphoesterase [Epulopiscium sp. SCG-B11WGA-EpuloA1]
MNILIIADQESPYIWDHFDKKNFENVEIVVSCGDLKASYLSFIVTMLAVPVIYIHGNHDVRYSTNPPEGCICIDDDVFTYKGIKFGGLGGCMEYSGGPLQYTEKAMNKRVKKLIKLGKRRGGIDVLITHSPSKNLGDGEDLCHQGFQAFYDIYEKFNISHHFYGHQHLNYSNKTNRCLTYKDIQIVNAFNYYIIEI